MKKALVVLACIFFLTALVGCNLRILEVRPVLADAYSALTVQFPIEHFGVATSSPTTIFTPQEILAVLAPQDIKTAYNLPSTGGNGAIAIIDPYNDPTIQNDLYDFSTEFGLPPPNSTNFEIHMMAQSISNTSDASEISMDVEWAHAIAPNAKILLVEAVNNVIGYNNGTPGPMLDAVNYARNRPDVIAISLSWYIPETGEGGINSTELSFDSYLTSSNGTAFFASSGDHGENATWPACSPNVVGVGGTTLNLYSNDSLASEVVWNSGNGWATGGGVSQYENETPYQLSYGIQGSNGHRGVPDVSFDAGTPVWVYDSFDNATYPWALDGGTSLGAPCWAGIYSLRPTASNPTVYALAKSVYNSSCFRDITNGTNGNYNATVGYDFCTGLGSPLTGAFNSSLPGDLNFDGTVDIYDAVLLANAFNANRTSTNWNALADINNDGTVDIYDAIILAGHFGETYGTGSDSVSGNSGTQPMQSGGTSVTVDPSSTTVFKGEVFNASVDVSSVTDLLGWEFQLYWNSTMLNCTNVAIQTPSQWQGSTLTVGPGLQENYNATTALYWQGQAGTYPASSFNGSMTMVTLTFQALQPGTTPLTLIGVKLANSTAQPIACSVSSGSVTVYYGRYMRSDTQTINGLNAYKLSIPESTSYAYFEKQASGSGVSWGIRAWIRHSNGAEQEISLNGQTGTPQAVVSRTSGSGLEGATVSVAQTTLQPTDSLVVCVYMNVGGSGWTLCATFTTEQLNATTLQATTWTVYYYTGASYSRQYGSTGVFYWGDTAHESEIQNLQYS